MKVRHFSLYQNMNKGKGQYEKGKREKNVR